MVGLLVLTFGSARASAQNAPIDEVPQEHVYLRDQLFAARESLLNVYRCQFDIDTHIVPGGHPNSAPIGAKEPPAVHDSRIQYHP